MIDPQTFADTFPAGAQFWFTKENLKAASDVEFHDAVQPIVEAGGGDGFIVLTTHRESYSGRRMLDIVKCRRHE
jgi:hypothetical protein